MQYRRQAYKGRNCIPRKREGLKSKLSHEEKRARKIVKQVSKLFPGCKCPLFKGTNFSIYCPYYPFKSKAV